MMKALIVASLFSISTLRAQDVPPPPRPADDGPSMEVTMKYIQDRLNSIDLTFTVKIDSFEEGFRVKVSDAAADAQGCKLSFRKVLTPTLPKFGGPMEYQIAASIRDIGKLSVEPGSGPEGKYVPEVYLLKIKMVPGKTAHFHYHFILDGKVNEGDREDAELRLELFTDEELAHRMAKAIVHAVELCGGGDKDPFK